MLKPGGKLVIVEPSKIQLQGSIFQLLKSHGFRGVYFYWLSHFVFEPYVKAWQSKDIGPWLEKHGFELIRYNLGVPAQEIVAR